jgi:hypothetical protein
MGHTMSIVIILLVVLVAAGVAMAVRAGTNRQQHVGAAARLAIQRSVGDDRYTTVTRMLNDLAQRGDSTRIAAVWEEIELPLLQILPDCPPDSKGPLIDALDAAALVCRNRDTAKGMMTLRDSMMGPQTESET